MAWVHPPAIGCRFSFLHLPCGRCGHTMNTYKDSLYVFGGYDGKRWLNDLYQFNTQSLVWSQVTITGPSPQPRQYHASATINNLLYIYGGYNGSIWLQDLIIADLESLKWRFPKTYGLSPTAKEGLAMASMGDYIYIHGGWNGRANGDLHKLNTITNEWSLIVTKGVRPELCGHSMTVVNDSLYIFGGFDGKLWKNSLFIINPDKAANWHSPSISNPPGVRGYHSAVLFNKHIIFYAGYNGKYILADIVALDIDSLTWFLPETCSGHFPSARNAHTMILQGSQLYLFGGYNGNRDTNELHILETSAFSSLHEDFKMALNHAPWKDVILYSNSGSCSVHSLLIKVRCKNLYNQILKSDPQFLNSGRIVGVNIGNCGKNALRLFCEYLYCDLNKEKLNGEVVDDLFSLAVRLELPSLHGVCRKFIYDSSEQVPESTLASDLMRIKEETKLSDYTVIIKGTCFKLHKLVLYTRCTYFRALFNSGMKESQLSSSSFDNIDIKAFEILVEWMYSDKFSPLFNDKNFNLEIGKELLNATNFLQLDSLRRITEITIWKLIDSNNAFKMLEIACLFNTNQLKSYCINFILRQFDSFSIRQNLAYLSADCKEELEKYLPKRSNRQQTLSMPSDLCMVKYEKEDHPPVNRDPVMVSGQLFQSLKITQKIVVKSYNPLNSIDLGLSSQNESIISNKPVSLRLKPRLQLKIRGFRAGGTIQMTDRKDPNKMVINRKPRSYKSLTHIGKELKESEKPEFFIKGFGSCRKGKSRMSSLVNCTHKSGLYSTGLHSFSGFEDSMRQLVLPDIKI